MRSYTLEDVSKHRTRQSLWVVVSNKVFDVTDFVGRHPGGYDTLIKNAGQDVTEVMQDVSSHKHSKAAYSVLNKYYIGDLTKDKNSDEHGDEIDYESKEIQETLQGWREDELVDWDKPITWQVGKLGSDYVEWVHSPVDRHIRLFDSDFCEYFSRTPWWMIPIFWIPVMSIFVYYSFNTLMQRNEQFTPWLFGGISFTTYSIPVLFFCGALSWSFVEYAIHRWIFHANPPANSPFLITLHFLLHGQHHKAPFDKQRLVFPIVPGVMFAVLFWAIYFAIFPKGTMYAILAGTIMGYMTYDLTHYYLHHGQPATAYFRSLKKYHVQHHFVNQHMGFGISSKLWDYPFGTLLSTYADKVN